MRGSISGPLALRHRLSWRGRTIDCRFFALEAAIRRMDSKITGEAKPADEVVQRLLAHSFCCLDTLKANPIVAPRGVAGVTVGRKLRMCLQELQNLSKRRRAIMSVFR